MRTITSVRPARELALDNTRRSWLDVKVKVSRFFAAILSVLAAGSVAADDPAPWNVIETERGITISRREQPGCGLPAFRGEGPVRGGVLQVLAAMLDIETVHLWAYGIDEARLVRRIDARTDLVYLYSDLPWPVRDRDMIVRREIEVVKPGSEFTIRLRCEPDAVPVRDGRVRVPECRSTFALRKLKADTTEVDYVMSLDPGGILPKWASNWVAKHVPFKTLVAIEERTDESRGQYEAVVQRWSTAM